MGARRSNDEPFCSLVSQTNASIIYTAWKVSKYGVFQIYSVNLCIQSECGKIRIRKTLYLDFSYSVKCSLTAQFLIKLLVQSHCYSRKYYKRNILIAILVITHEVGWCDVPLSPCDWAIAIRSLRFAQAIRKAHSAQHWLVPP